MKLKKVIILLLSVLMVMNLTACSEKDSNSGEESKKEVKTIKIGTCDVDLEDIVRSVEDEFLEKGYKMEMVMFTDDIIAPNNAVAEGSLDANFYQHVPYLEDFNRSKGTELVPIGESIFYSKMGLYSDKIKSTDEIKDGMTIAISSDATNRTRALLFMQHLGLIKLKDGLEVYSKLDVEENKYNLEIIELDYVMIPSSLPDVDMLIIYPYDMELAGYDIEPIEYDPSEIGRKYGIVLATDKKNEDTEWAKILAELLKGEKTKEVVKKYYKDTGAHISEY